MTDDRKLVWVLIVFGLWALGEALVAVLPFDDLGTIVLVP